MAQLANLIAQAKAQETAAAEAEIASCFPPPPQLSPEQQQKLIPFLAWCEQSKVHAVPARPTTCAAYAQYQQDMGVSRQVIAERLEAIAALHEAASWGNPTATSVVRTVTGGSTIEAPRSWTREERQNLWPQLPPDIQQVIARREHDRERTLRQAQNEAGELRNALKRLNQTAADPKPVETQKVNANGE